MRPGLGQQGSRHIGEQPHQPVQTIAPLNGGESVAASHWTNPRQAELGRALRQMLQRPALQIDQLALARWVHHLEHKRRATVPQPGVLRRLGPRRGNTFNCRQMEVVVVLGGESFCSGLQPVQLARKADRFAAN